MGGGGGHYGGCQWAAQDSLTPGLAGQTGRGCLHRPSRESCRGLSQEGDGGAKPAALEGGMSWNKKLEALVEENQQCCWLRAILRLQS